MSTLSKQSKKRLAVALSVVGLLAVGVAAYAWWSAAGGGTATGTSASGNAAAVNAHTTSSLDGLFPGGSVPITGDFINSGNGNSVHVNGLTATVSVTPTTGNTCAASNYSVTGLTVTTPDVAAHSTGGAFTGTLNMADLASNQDGCKGATVTLTYSVS
jgi:hypothetical protein